MEYCSWRRGNLARHRPGWSHPGRAQESACTRNKDASGRRSQFTPALKLPVLCPAPATTASSPTKSSQRATFERAALAALPCVYRKLDSAILVVKATNIAESDFRYTQL